MSQDHFFHLGKVLKKYPRLTKKFPSKPNQSGSLLLKIIENTDLLREVK